jgi:hypothetical protein
VLLLPPATGSTPRRFSFRRSSLLAWRSSFFISRRSLRERSVGATDESGVWDADKLGEGDADGSTVGRARSARGVGVTTGALGLRDADSIGAAVALGLSLERDLSTGDRAEVGLAAADGAGLAVALGDADGDDVDLASGRGINFGRGVVVAVSTGVAVARAVADGVAVVSGVVRRTGVAVAVMVAELAGVEVEVALADGTAVAAEDVDVVDVSAAASVGFTNVFGGAFGGGVASAFIFTRTFSVAWRSAVFSQPRSTTTLVMVSLTLRGRSIAWPRAIKGAGMTMA